MNFMVETYDIEIYKGMFSYIGLDIKTEQLVKFVIHPELNQSKELYKHLQTLKRQIGFNNISFDYPIIHLFLTSREIKRNIKENKPREIIDILYKKAQEIIQKQNKKGKKEFTGIPTKDIKIGQLDLFKVWHYNNKARSTSLKSLEISMNFPNVMESSVPFDKENITLDEVEEILQYNENDVRATYEFFKKTIQLGKIELRKKIREDYNLDCVNWDNGKIGENLILKLYCDKTGANIYDVKQLRSYYDKIEFKDCIPEGITFLTKKFNETLNKFNKKIIKIDKDKDKEEDDNTKKKKKNKKDNEIDKVVYKDCLIVYGCGGVHGMSHSKVYESDDIYIIKTADVASLYPNIPIKKRFYISHLGWEFLEVYEQDIVNVRLAEKAKPKNEQNKTIIDGFKEAANIPYGKSNDINSFLYDPLYTYKTTVTGQLLLTQLVERLGETIKDFTLIMFNTDGFEVRIKREDEELYNKICNEWEQETGLILEFDTYQKMWARDVNNYGSITTSGKIKNKGTFEVDKVIGTEPAYHKDNSFRVVKIALQEFFVNNIPVETTIKNHYKNEYKGINNYGIYDFCGREKFKGKDYGETNELRYDELGNPYNHSEIQQKHTRFYISNSKKTFFKVYGKGSREVINKGFEVTIFNKFVEKPWEEYDINYDFYIKEAQKEINEIVGNQISLF